MEKWSLINSLIKGATKLVNDLEDLKYVLLFRCMYISGDFYEWSAAVVNGCETNSPMYLSGRE